MLKKFGYRVITAASGEEALKIYEKRSGEIDLIIVDLIMPEMDGKECATQLRRIDPRSRILISSGYIPGSDGLTELKEKIDGFLQKPYSLQKLMEVIRYTLNKTR